MYYCTNYIIVTSCVYIYSTYTYCIIYHVYIYIYICTYCIISYIYIHISIIYIYRYHLIPTASLANLFYFFIFIIGHLATQSGKPCWTSPWFLLGQTTGSRAPGSPGAAARSRPATPLISRACVGIAPHIQDVHVELPSVLLFFLREIPGTRKSRSTGWQRVVKVESHPIWQSSETMRMRQNDPKCW